ncbi:DUF3955 domain-containing protein [Tepidibacter aestuarii]|uniref:DUF3955 domain-containing protein n=1 Tax=Tepidibacter aestuarii TaxID=2925782 RepID=UPI0020BD53F2|nr:DUF3955 domain-containing protein [Tepidibacter aestuarii]CAH2215406.1 Prokaryotic membrane lipoprotein lipid attachment site profile [Tepidibacter aestuarii]
MKNLMKKNLLTLIPFIIGFGCFIAYNIIGSEVAPDGTLIEPFGLIPLGYLFIFIGIIASIVSFFSKYKKSYK